MGKPRRVIVIGPQFGGGDGLSELGRQVVLALAVDPADPVTVHSMQDPARPAMFADAPVRFTFSNGSRSRFVAAIFAEAIGVSSDDVVVVLHAHFLPLTLPLLARGATLASVLVGIESWRPLTILQRAALSRAAHVVAISRHTVDRFEAANPGVVRPAIRVCHPARPASGEASPGLLTPGYALMVGRMAREERYKGHDEVIEAWPHVRASHPGARLVIAGDGDDRPRLQAKAASLGLADAVLFLGTIARSRLNGVYDDAAFFVMPSRDEGFGFVYLEAMQAGKACIACPGSAAEILENQRSGLLVEYGSVSAIERACIRLFSDALERARLGKAGADAVQRRFLPRHFAARFREALGMAPAGGMRTAPEACA